MGKTKISIWKMLSEELSGNYIESQYDYSDKAVIGFNGFQIIFDNYTIYRTVGLITAETTYTRIICPYISGGNFKFQIYRKSILDTIGKLFGAQDILIGHEAFDKEFIIKSNDDYKLLTFLGDNELLELIRNEKQFYLEISVQKGIWEETLPENNYELSFYFEGISNSIENLKSLYLIFTKLVTRLSMVERIAPATNTVR